MFSEFSWILSASSVSLAFSAFGVTFFPSEEDASVTGDGNGVPTKLPWDCAGPCDCFSSVKKSLKIDFFLSVSSESFVTAVDSVL